MFIFHSSCTFLHRDYFKYCISKLFSPISKFLGSPFPLCAQDECLVHLTLVPALAPHHKRTLLQGNVRCCPDETCRFILRLCHWGLPDTEETALPRISQFLETERSSPSSESFTGKPTNLKPVPQPAHSGHTTPCPSHPTARNRTTRVSPRPQSPPECCKLANPKPARPALPLRFHGNHSRGPCPGFPLSLCSQDPCASPCGPAECSTPRLLETE